MAVAAAAPAFVRPPPRPAANPLSNYAPATLTRIGAGNYIMTGEVDRSTFATIRLNKGQFTIELRAFRTGGADPVLPPPRAMTKSEMSGLRQGLDKFIKNTPGRQAMYVSLRDQLAKQVKSAS